MSRRRTSDAHYVFSGVRLLCPDGHPLGMAAKQRGRYMLEPGLIRVDSPDGRTKIKARCSRCEARGVTRDLQASWEGKLMPMLDAMEPDPSAGVSDYRIGG